MRPHVRLQRDRAQLLPHYGAALDHVLHAVEHAPARTRGSVTIRCQAGKLVIVTSMGWQLSCCRLGEHIALNILRGPRLDHGRRAALRDAHDAHQLESEPWLAWALAVTTTTGPKWPALSDFMRAPARRKAA